MQHGMDSADWAALKVEGGTVSRAAGGGRELRKGRSPAPALPVARRDPPRPFTLSSCELTRWCRLGLLRLRDLRLRNGKPTCQ